MNSYEITPQNKVVPSTNVWTFEPTQLEPYAQAAASNVAMEQIVKRNHVRSKLNFNVVVPDAPSALEQECSPLRSIVPLVQRKGFDLTWMDLWEVFGVLFDYYNGVVGAKLSTKERKLREKDPESMKKGQIGDFPIRSFHIADNTGRATEVMGEIARKVNFTNNTPVAWDWMANYRASNRPIGVEKFKQKWLVGADGDGACKPANMRSWKNRIVVDLGKLDVVTSHDDDVAEAVGAMAFALMHLQSGGCAIIRVPNFASTAILTLTHLFAQCFDATVVVNTLAGDNIYVCGTGFVAGNITAKHQKLLFDFIEEARRDPNTSLYALRFIPDAGFIQYIQNIEQIQESIFRRRIDRYSAIIVVHNSLQNSGGAKMFSGSKKYLIDEKCPDRSNSWAEITGIGQIVDLAQQIHDDKE